MAYVFFFARNEELIENCVLRWLWLSCTGKRFLPGNWFEDCERRFVDLFLSCWKRSPIADRIGIFRLSFWRELNVVSKLVLAYDAQTVVRKDYNDAESPRRESIDVNTWEQAMVVKLIPVNSVYGLCRRKRVRILTICYTIWTSFVVSLWCQPCFCI